MKGGKAQLASLDDVDADVVYAGINLLDQEVLRHMMNVVHSRGVLRSESGRGRHGIAPMSRDDLLVCL